MKLRYKIKSTSPFHTTEETYDFEVNVVCNHSITPVSSSALVVSRIPGGKVAPNHIDVINDNVPSLFSISSCTTVTYSLYKLDTASNQYQVADQNFGYIDGTMLKCSIATAGFY